MREQSCPAFFGKPDGGCQHCVRLVPGCRLAQQARRTLEPGVERGQFRVGCDLSLQCCGFVGREFAHEQCGDAHFEFLAW